MDETGRVYLSEHMQDLGIEDAYIEREKQAQLRTLGKRRAQYTPVRPPLDPAGRIVIVVDNGIATGASMIAALRAVRAEQPRLHRCGRCGTARNDRANQERSRRGGVSVCTGLFLCGGTVSRGLLAGVR